MTEDELDKDESIIFRRSVSAEYAYAQVCLILGRKKKHPSFEIV